MESKDDPSEIIVRSYKDGDEERILEFLNLCYGGNWGNMQKWKYLYTDQPLFTKFDIAIMETKGKIIGYGGMHFRNFVLNDKKLLAVLLGDGGVHPEYRGMRLHSKLLGERFQRAGNKNACLCFGWVLKNSDAYKSDMRAGFVEAKEFPTYMRILNYDKVLKAGLTDLLTKNKRLRTALLSLEYPIYFQTNGVGFSLSELVNEVAESSQKRIEIFLGEDAIKHIYNFRSIGKTQRTILLAYLLVLRKIKISFPSFMAFYIFIKNAKAIASSF